MPYCVRCSGIDIQRFRTAEGLIVVYRLLALKNGAKQGCSFCRFLCETLEKEIEQAKTLFHDAGCLYLYMYADGKAWTREYSMGLRINELNVCFAQGYWGMSPRLTFGPAGVSNDRVVAQHTYRVLADIDSGAARNNDVIGTYLGDDPRSIRHVVAIQEWLIDCLKNHSDCCKRASGGDPFDARDVPLPSRCLDIKDPKNVKLVETRGERGAYFALSHRWEKALDRHESTASDVPRCDSLFKATGMQYLWIDSLCIIQDGDQGKDWKHEAVHMGQYYQYSLVTIAVTTSPDGVEGCFPARQSPLTGPLARLPYRDAQGREDGFMYIHKREGTVHDDYHSTILESGLLRRGWVLQEWLLSRRLIFITPTQLFFECQSQWPNNEYKETAHLNLELGRISSRLHSEWRVPLKPLFSYRTKPAVDLWCTIVETYSTLCLTKPELDLIIAIAGIAEEIKQMMEQEMDGLDPLEHRSEYVAGLWLRNIHHGLLWEQRTRSPVTLSHCGAPTWSWASNLISVKWQARGKRVQNACKIIALTLDDGRTFRLEEIPDERNRTDLESATSTNAYSNQEEALIRASESFGVINTFTCLKIRGQIRPFLIGRYLTLEESTKISECTGRAINFSRLWRAVSDPLVLGRHLGWASIEAVSVNRQLQDSQSDQSSGSILLYALHVSTMKGESGGIQFGRLGFTHSVCCLLFVEPLGEEIYHRVGTGRIFQSEYFKGVEGQDLQLL